MKSKNLQSVMGASSSLLQKLANSGVSDGDLIHISKVLQALSENPGAVSVDQSRLNFVWRRYLEYVRVYPKGYILVLIAAPFVRHESAISNAIKTAGIKESHFKVEVVGTGTRGCINRINSDECRVVLYTDGLHKTILEELKLYEKSSEKFASASKKSVFSAIARLSKKLGYD